MFLALRPPKFHSPGKHPFRICNSQTSIKSFKVVCSFHQFMNRKCRRHYLIVDNIENTFSLFKSGEFLQCLHFSNQSFQCQMVSLSIASRRLLSFPYPPSKSKIRKCPIKIPLQMKLIQFKSNLNSENSNLNHFKCPI